MFFSLFRSSLLNWLELRQGSSFSVFFLIYTAISVLLSITLVFRLSWVSFNTNYALEQLNRLSYLFCSLRLRTSWLWLSVLTCLFCQLVASDSFWQAMLRSTLACLFVLFIQNQTYFFSQINLFILLSLLDVVPKSYQNWLVSGMKDSRNENIFLKRSFNSDVFTYFSSYMTDDTFHYVERVSMQPFEPLAPSSVSFETGPQIPSITVIWLLISVQYSDECMSTSMYLGLKSLPPMYDSIFSQFLVSFFIMIKQVAVYLLFSFFSSPSISLLQLIPSYFTLSIMSQSIFSLSPLLTPQAAGGCTLLNHQWSRMLSIDILLLGVLTSRFWTRSLAAALKCEGILKLQVTICLQTELIFWSQKGRYPASITNRMMPRLHRSDWTGLQPTLPQMIQGAAQQGDPQKDF